MKYRHLVSFVSEEESDLIEGISWNEGFSNLFFEKTVDSGIALHVLLEEGEELPYFLSKMEFSDLGFTEQKDWFEKWKETLVPFELCKSVEVLPLEEEKKVVDPNKIGIIPGMAFGTGLHESTKLAASLLVEAVVRGSRVLDVGCGTGILSAIAAKKGASQVVALDIDEHSVEKTNETARINDVYIDARQSEFLSSVKPEERFDIIVSNMIVELLREFVLDLERFLDEHGTVILSGIFKDKFSEIGNLIEGTFLIESSREDGDWKAIKLRRK